MNTEGKTESYIELRGELNIPEAIHGKSAYEIAVINGFDGTEEEWLASLVGPKGKDGQTGAKIISTVSAGQDASGGNIYRQTFDNGTIAMFTAPKGDKGDKGDTGAVATVLQRTGNSENDVMSQKAVTDIFNRNDKRITNLEQGVADQFETDSSVAYIKAVPGNALPYAEVKKVGGMTYKDGNTLNSAPVTEVKSVGANLFDVSKFVNTAGLEVFDDKIVVTTSAYDSSVNSSVLLKDFAPYLRVGDIVTLNASTTGAEKYVWIDSVWGFGEAKTITETLLNSFVYFYASGAGTSATISEIMLNKGSSALPYSPYQEHTLPIPEAVQSLEGYGQGNPDDTEEYNAIIWDEDGTRKYLHKGNFVDGVWVAFPTTEVTDISDILPADNFIEVEGGGTLTFVNENSLAVPSEIEYQLEV